MVEERRGDGHRDGLARGGDEREDHGAEVLDGVGDQDLRQGGAEGEHDGLEYCLGVVLEEAHRGDEPAGGQHCNEHQHAGHGGHREGQLKGVHLRVLLEQRVLEVRRHGVEQQEAEQQRYAELPCVEAPTRAVRLEAEDHDGGDDDEGLRVVEQRLGLAAEGVHHEDRQQLRGLRRRLQREGDVGQALVLAPGGHEVGGRGQAAQPDPRKPEGLAVQRDEDGREERSHDAVEENQTHRGGYLLGVPQLVVVEAGHHILLRDAPEQHGGVQAHHAEGEVHGSMRPGLLLLIHGREDHALC
mmetsp:Transcript_73010/g.213918  ORF Transcript_73010/g.213918 Transcript_73010/m.213918 type:complete len:299 (-) Transcript_73010:178-1074(-)